MGMVNDIGKAFAAAQAAYANPKTKEPKVREQNQNLPEAVESKDETGRITGKTIGDVKLSDGAAKVYDELKSKYGDMEFILVSEKDRKQVEANAAKYGTVGKTVVLINEDKLEQMAKDESYRKKVEGIITSSRDQIEQAKEQLANSPIGSGVKTIGVKVGEDGKTSFFADVDKNAKASADAQKKRIEAKKEEKAKEAKADKKRAEKEKNAERIEKRRSERAPKEEIERIESDSMESLIKKIEDVTYSSLSDSVMTESEKAVGQSIDFKG